MIAPGSPSEEGFCAKCRYPLRGLPEPRCPECGSEFDPANACTFLVARQRWALGPISRRVWNPPTWRLHALSAIPAVLILFSYSVPGQVTILRDLGSLIAIALLVFWLLRLLASLAVDIIYRPPADQRRAPGPWLLTPLIILVTAVLCRLDVPAHVAFALSRPSLDRLAARAATTPLSSPLTDRWVGVYPVKEIRRRHGGIRICVLGTCGLGGGLAWFPQGPPVSSEYVYFHWCDSWYGWHDMARRNW